MICLETNLRGSGPAAGRVLTTRRLAGFGGPSRAAQKTGAAMGELLGLNRAKKHARKKSSRAPARGGVSRATRLHIRGQKSPTGEPTYFNKPTVTMQTLNPPPANKKRRTGPAQTSSPSVQQSNGTSPQLRPRRNSVRTSSALASTRTPRC
ncbi:hypothetical protein B0T14DRAFT_126619 [Immersiella caudata]|uniref:Uncharacterized protein n=1 Tax=Immersiella caudata TaxID=314043 RepID=A0AA39X4I6_9PEZI|nr:hypothetical protein B0T14DRAFT_126619 [Immersiella caudata]